MLRTLRVYSASCVFQLWVVASLVVYATLFCSTVWCLPRSWVYPLGIGWGRGVLWVAKVVCGIDWKIDGLQHVPQHPVVFMSRHESAWETIALTFILQRQVAYVIKKELLRIPFFGWGLAQMPIIAIDRKRGVKSLQSIIEQGSFLLQQGFSIVIFPEGTRALPQQILPFHASAAKLAQKNQADVVPIALNSGRLWGKNSFLRYPGLITVKIGPAMSSHGRDHRELAQAAEQWVHATQAQLRVQSA